MWVQWLVGVGDNEGVRVCGGDEGFRGCGSLEGAGNLDK